MKHVLLAVFPLLFGAIAGSATANCVTDTAQADFQAGVANSVDLTTSPGNVLLSSRAGGAGGIDQQSTVFNTPNPNGNKFLTTQWAGQTFTAGVSGSLTRVDVNLFCVFCSSAPPSIIVSIRATSGGFPTGADLATATLNITDWSGSYAFYPANFAAPATLSAGTQYAILIRPSAAVTSGTLGFTDSAISASIGNDVYAGGALLVGASSGASWSVQTYGTAKTTADGAFKTYMGGGGSSYSTSGDLISSAKDSNPQTGSTTWSTLGWNGTVPTSTTLRFQAAASNSATGTFSFVGPDGSASTYFTSGASLGQFNGNRYLKYRAFLTSANGSSTPTLADATVCYSVSAPPSADLSISNDDGTTTATPGSSVTYTIIGSNAGPSSASGATVTDAFPAGLTCSWTCSASSGAACNAAGANTASGSGNINGSVGLPVGANVTYTATCSIAASASGSLVNTASIASSLADPSTTNNSDTDTDTLASKTNVMVTLTDNVNLVRVGDVVTYVVEVTNNAGPSNATAIVSDALPAQLSGGSWVCSAVKGAACGSASGSGNTLSDTATLPTGSQVDYQYTATVMSANSSGQVSNSASVRTSSGTNSPSSNITASDADTVVIFVADFDSSSKAMSMSATGNGASMTVQLGVDAGLLNKVSVAPVTVATGRSASGKKLFSLQLMRLGSDIVMRTLTTIDDSEFSDVSAWKAVDLKQHVIALGWQSASSHGDDGYLSVSTGATQMPLAANNAHENLMKLETTVENNIPWLVSIGQ